MESRTNYALVGAFVLMLGTGLIAALLWFAAGGPGRHDYEHYLVYTTESVWALPQDAAVRYHGVRVGHVSQIGLDPTNPSRVRLLLDIEHGTPIKADTRATLQLQGITGSAFVSLTGGATSSPPLQRKGQAPYPVIKTSPSLMQRLDVIVNQVGKSVTQSSERLAQLLSDRNIAHVSHALANLDALSANLAGHAGRMDDAIAQFDALMRQTRASTAQLPALMHHLDQLTAEVSHSARAIQRTLPQTDQALRQFTATVRSYRQLSNQLQQDPSALLYGPTPPTPGPGE
ncbi:hypothetical protein BI364_05365 [Acidihalobacter yilgarnensis]|uniref:Mce/MlaD domain-containing protein n=1 Tax=Acidihalobacter yilgarnensis TaxID=2819280 RepID=A0A1D8IM01_9GAMM|nr:MlaD family protein [Acidihalobacter yilgarnensis]AOU97477.1 hypothetical protein BI364_05365 [Acidihalobacter yilgarnensis]